MKMQSIIERTFISTLTAVILLGAAFGARAQFGGGAIGGGGAGGSFGAFGFGYIPFGGPILAMRPGSNCIHITVGPPRPGDFVYVPGGSMLFSYFTLRVGANVLGLAGPDVFCLLGRRLGFTGPLILIVGTSH